MSNDLRYSEVRFKERIESKRDTILRAKIMGLKKRYEKAVKYGDWSYYVPEFEDYDSFEEYRELKNKKIEMEDLSSMAKLEIDIRLSKNYNVGGIKVTEIENKEDYKLWKEWALQNARELWTSLPDKNENKVPTPKVASGEDYAQAQSSKANTYNSKHLPTNRASRGYGSDKQWNLYNKNTDKLTNHPQFQANNIHNRDDLSKALDYIISTFK